MLERSSLPCNKSWQFFISILVCIIFFSFGVFLSSAFCEEQANFESYQLPSFGDIHNPPQSDETISTQNLNTPKQPEAPIHIQEPPKVINPPENVDKQVKNKRRDCWFDCDKRSGMCDFCGTGKCCRKGEKGGGVCTGEVGCSFKHCCIPLAPGDEKRATHSITEVAKEEIDIKEEIQEIICEELECSPEHRKVDTDGDNCLDTCEACEPFTCDLPLVPADADLDGCSDFCRIKLLSLKINFVGPDEIVQQEDYTSLGMAGEIEGITIEASGFDRAFSSLTIPIVAGWYGRKWKSVMRGGLQGIHTCDGTIKISGLEPGRRYWVKSWHHNVNGLETTFYIDWNDGEKAEYKHTQKARHCNKITQHKQDIFADEDGMAFMHMKSDPSESKNLQDDDISCTINALELKEYCYGDETCLPHERCSNGVCHRDLTQEFTDETKARKKNRIGVIGVWLGWEWPLYLNLTFESFRQNSDIFDFYVFTNMTSNHYVPPNSAIEVLHVTRRDFFERFAFITDDEKRAYRDFPGKFVNDLKHVFPILFPEILESYDYWGWIDLDIILGDVSNWLQFDSDLDVVSFSEGYFKTVHLRGQFSIFRNVPRISEKWKGDECFPHLEMELKHMYNFAYNKPMHKNDEGCFSWSLMNDPEVNVRLYPYQIHDHHVRSIHYARGKVFACNARRREKCKEFVEKYLGILKNSNECATEPKFVASKEAWRGPLVNEVGTGLRDKRCMTWVPSPFRISCVNVSNDLLARSDYYRNDYLVESYSSIEDVVVKSGQFSECIGDGEHLREVMLAHWKKFKPFLASQPTFRPLGRNEVFSVYRDEYEIYTIESD